MKYIAILAATLAFTACAAQEKKKSSANCDPMELLQGKSCIEPDYQEIAKHPLGSEDNPVRAAGVAGQREYLSRLICADGQPITQFSRVGSVGEGPYGFILDLYEVTCNTDQGFVTHSVYMDLYHKDYRESLPAKGFSALKQ